MSQSSLAESDPEIAKLISKEAERKEFSLELIPSENCVSQAVLEADGSILTDKYCEGYPGGRYYGGCENYDVIENIARDRAKQMFGAEFVNVQPHSGSNANMAVYFGLLKIGDTVLGPKLDHGGHLTHGSPVNFSGKFFNIVGYGVHPETHVFEADEILRLAREHKPKMIIAGATAYSRKFDWAAFRKAADEVGAILMADVAHYAGLIVGGVYPNPITFADVVTTTTHKTLRGPRGGIVLSNKPNIIKAIDKIVFPGIQGGPLMHQIAAKAVAFGEALRPDFKTYAANIVENARTLSAALVKHGYSILTGGTDSHLMVLDLRPLDLSGADVETALGKVGITVNKNTVPNDPKPPKVTSGIRLGTPAITSRGFTTADMQVVADCIHDAIQSRGEDAKLAQVRERVRDLCKKHPLFPR
ncbi:MAG: serine hydroxymethyltransferase [Bdellovibrionota bacterium]